MHPKNELAVFNMLERLQKNLLDMLIIQGIKHRLAFLPPLNNSHVAECSQLMGNGRLPHVEKHREIMHA